MTQENEQGAGLSKLNVLVVDDNDQALAVMQKILKKLGVENIYSASDGKSALEFLTKGENSVNTILCDWQMPEMNGLDLLKEIRHRIPGMHFIMVTGKRDIESVQLAVRSEVDSFLCKPFTPQQLQEKLKTISRGR